MAMATFKRYECKSILDEVQYHALILELNDHMRPDDYCRRNRHYTINNIYFDTPDFQIIRHSLSKPFYKEKLRLRSYGGPAQPDQLVFLELKKKMRGIVNKRRAALQLGDAYAYLESGRRPAHMDYVDNQVLNEIDFFQAQHPVRPAAYISYQRTAWFGREDSEFRITIDQDILTRWEDLSLESGRLGTSLLKPGQRLLEIKTCRAVPLWLASLMSNHRIYPTSFSKYGEMYKTRQLGIRPYPILQRAV